MVPPPKVTNNRKINPVWPLPPAGSKWTDWTIQDYVTPSWTEVRPVAYSKWDGDAKVKPSPLPEWVKEYMDVQSWNYDHDQVEVVGLLLVDPVKPDSDKAAVVYLTSKFLALIDRAREEGTKLIRLPEIVIGQVANGYQAQVTLTVHWQGGY